MATDFSKFLHGLSAITPDALADLEGKLEEKDYLKGEFLLESGHICSHLFFINQGLAKMFFYKEDKEFIMRFFPEKSLLTGLDSYITGQPSNFSVIALEPTAITFISKADIESLCCRHRCLEVALRSFFSVIALHMMSRISEMLEEDATTRYNGFITANKELFNRISLGDLASYLGITQVSLSRIRAKK